MKIGIDLDNTIAIYDNLFSKYASNLLGVKGCRNKKEVAHYLKNQNREKDWTFLQGEVYGKYMTEASVAKHFIERISSIDLSEAVFEIVSHRSLFPSSGALYNMRNIAYDWIELNISPYTQINIYKSVFFFETIEEKIQFISESSYFAFVDDLPFIFENNHFPKNTRAFLFTNGEKISNNPFFEELNSWENFNLK